MLRSAVEHARAPGWDRPQVFGTESSPEPRITRVDPGSAAVHDYGFNNADGHEYDQPVDRRARADLDSCFAPGRESREPDLHAVVTGRQGGEAELPLLVGELSDRAADQRRRTDDDLRAADSAALFILHRADQCAGESLGVAADRSSECEGGDNRERTDECPDHSRILRPGSRRSRDGVAGILQVFSKRASNETPPAARNTYQPNATPARRVHKRGTNVSPGGLGSSSKAGQSLAASTRRPTRRDCGQYARPPPRPTHSAAYGLLETAVSDTRRKGCTLRWSCRAKGWYEAARDATNRLPAPNSAPTATGVPITSHSAPPDR